MCFVCGWIIRDFFMHNICVLGVYVIGAFLVCVVCERCVCVVFVLCACDVYIVRL